MAPCKVIIIGSGLAGNLLGNGLMRHDVDFAIYERDAEDAKREGYQIRLGGNALLGMRACLEPDRLAAIVKKFGRAGGRLASAPVCRDKHFNTICDFSKLENYSKSAPINRIVLREALAEPISESGRLTYGKAFRRYEILQEDGGRERVRVHFDDGSHDDCDMLIGSDGSSSRVNRQLGLNNLKTVDSHVSFICKRNLPTAKFLELSPALCQNPVLSFAEGKAMFFAAYLPPKVVDPNSVDDPTKETASVDFDDTQSSCMFSVSISAEKVPESMFRATPEEKWAFLDEQMVNWSSEYQEVLKLVRGTDFHVYKARVSTKPSLNWRSDVRSLENLDQGHPRVILLGDAMHAMLPARGMGGNTALRDTAVLLPQLVDLAKSGKYTSTQDVAAACKVYEDEMIPRAFTWVAKSGYDQIMPFDFDTWTGTILVAIAKPILQLLAYWFSTKSYILGEKDIVDDAPELRN